MSSLHFYLHIKSFLYILQPKAQTFRCLFDHRRDSQQKQRLLLVLLKSTVAVMDEKHQICLNTIKRADELQGLTGKQIHGDMGSGQQQLDKKSESLITKPCLFWHFDYE